MGHFGNGNRSAIVVGVNGSQKCDPPAPLKHAEKDAYELAAVLQTEYCSFSRVITLVGDGATSSSVLDGILGEIELVGEQDTLVFFYSGHGIPIAKSQGGYDVFLVTSDFNRQFAKHMPDRYVSLRKLRDLVYHCGAKQVVIVLDCCFSGEFGRDVEKYQDIVAAIAEYFDVQPRDRSPNGSLRQALTASSHDAKASEANGQSMTRRLLPFLRGEQGARDVVDDDGYVTLTSIYEFLVGDMASGPPNLPGDPAGQRALLAFHPHLAPASIKAREVADRDRIADEMQRIHSRLDEITDAQPFVDRQVASFDQQLIRKVGVELLETPALNLFCTAERIYKQSEYQSGAKPRDVLKLFGLIEDGHQITTTVAALLCFANNPRSYPFLEGAFTRCVVFPGKDTRSTPIDDVTFSQPLLMQFQESISFLRRNLRLQRTSTDLQSPDRWEIPFEALREALANAYIHREYEGRTDGILIQIFQDRVVISSPGQLPEGMDLAELTEPGQGKLRNAKIARVFYICGFVETLGTGVERLQHALQEVGLEPATFSQPARKGLKRFEVVFKRPSIALQQDNVSIGDVVGSDVYSVRVVQQPFVPRPVTATREELAEAFARLATLPTEAIPEPQDTLPPNSRVTLRRNPQFVGRDADLLALARLLKGGQSVAVSQAQSAVASGLGGIGKTQLAIEFAYRYGHFFTGVFLLSFAQPDAISTEFARLGGAGGLQLFTEAAGLQIDEQANLVRSRLACGLPYLLIFDNCDNPELVRAHHPGGATRVLITSRNANWPSDLGVGRHALSVLSRDESIALVRQHRPDMSNQEAGIIAAELGDLPLALHLAGRFLAGPGRRLLVERYLEELRSPRLFERLPLRERDGALPTGHSRDVARSFALSYERLNPHSAEDAIALRLLARAAYLVPGEIIPEALLRATLELPTDDLDAELSAEAALERLVGLGLLERETDEGLRMHRLVGAYVRQVSTDSEAQGAAERAVIVAAANLTNAPNLAPISSFLPVLRAVTDAALGRVDGRVADLCTWLGKHLYELGFYASAQPYLERALAISESILGSEHPDTASSLNNLALLLQAKGDYTAARPLYEHALALRESVLGADHPDTAGSLNNLALLLQAQGEYAAARPLYERALAISEAVLGAEHPDTASSLNNLAFLLQAQGDYAAARPLYERALALRESVLGAEHPDTAGSLNNLALLLQAQGDYTVARPLYERALAINEAVLGAEHPQIATSLNNLAGLLTRQGDYETALPLYERALAITESVLGSEHPQTATTLNNLASLYQSQGNYEAAVPLYERALAITDGTLGANHPAKIQSRNNLAQLLKSQVNYEEPPLLPSERVPAIGLNNLAEPFYLPLDLELIITRTKERTSATMRFELPGRRAELTEDVVLTLDATALSAIEHIPDAYGAALTAMAFPPLLQKAWQWALSYAKNQNVLLSVRLQLRGDDALHALRWELLRDPITQTPLAYHEHVAFSRSLGKEYQGDLHSATKPQFRAVVAVADAAGPDMIPVDVGDEVSRAQAGLGDLPMTVIDGRDGRPSATLAHLAEALRDEPSILYLTCHGALIDGQPYLYLSGEETPTRGVDFISQFANLQQQPLLVFLNVCQSGGYDYATMAAIGTQLASADIPAVIGMQHLIDTAAAATFIQAMMRELEHDGRIDRAMAAARKELNDEWWTPILWLGTRDGRLWRKKAAPVISDVPNSIHIGGNVGVVQQVTISGGSVGSIIGSQINIALPSPRKDLTVGLAKLLEDIAVIAVGNDTERPAVAQKLAQVEQNGLMLREPVERIWSGERDRDVLVVGLDVRDTFLVERILELIKVVQEKM
jgi:predicted HTH transcriptional regulator/tetratricopeptide (TPR) repeat protein